MKQGLWTAGEPLSALMREGELSQGGSVENIQGAVMTLDLLIGERLKCTNCGRVRVCYYAYEWGGVIVLCRECNEHRKRTV